MEGILLLSNIDRIMFLIKCISNYSSSDLTNITVGRDKEYSISLKLYNKKIYNAEDRDRPGTRSYIVQ